MGGAELLLAGQLSTQTENVNPKLNKKKRRYYVVQKYVRMVSKNDIFQKIFNHSVYRNYGHIHIIFETTLEIFLGSKD